MGLFDSVIGAVSGQLQGGLGDVVNSWVGKGENLPISAEQLTSVLGNDTLTGLAGNFGVNTNDLAGQLSSVLPDIVDKLTPDGQAPAVGLGNGGDLMGMLDGLLKG